MGQASYKDLKVKGTYVMGGVDGSSVEVMAEI